MTKPAKRRLLDGTMRLISLVPRGANQVAALYKNRDAMQLDGVAKMDSEGLLTSIVYLVEQADSHGDIAAKDVVKGYCHNFIPNMEGNGIDVMHDCDPVGADRAHIAENFIVQKGDPRFQNITDEHGKKVDATDAWATVVKIHDPILKAPYANGEWVGVSMFGSAIVEPLTKQTQPTPQENPDMDETKMAELLKNFGEDLGSKIVTGLAKALEPKKVEKTEVAKSDIPFEGDPMNADDLAKHADKVVLKSCDLSTPEGIAKWSSYVAKKSENAPAEDTDQLRKEVEALQARINKSESASNANPSDGTPVSKGGTIQDKLARGRARAAELKKSGALR